MRSSTVTTALSSNEIDARLRKLGGWKLDAGKLVRTFEFPDFRASHHPDIDIRYNKVHLELVTHDAGGITAKDFEVAEAISRLQ
jgi:4a-hydroxytetrahydrobiopterin dehydratase